ncbi:MAG: outer membrane protein transport protein [Candidatus Omnitrophica bacterium]|nr:outer membrane protein transport protein [Candidatus Omnitrophota bacterium]
MQKIFYKLSFFTLLSFVLIVPGAYAVGSGAFENASFSAQSLGQGGTGVGDPNEPAAISYNPAGLTDLPGIQVQSHTSLISLFTFIDGTNTGSTRSSGTLNVVPTAYLTVNPGQTLNNRLAFGVGMDSPFGFSDKYDSNHQAVRYTGWRNWLKMYAIKPTVAFKITDWLSFGGGPMYYRIFDFGSVLAYPNSLIFGAGTPDGQLRANLSGNSWGWHMGTLIKLNEKNRLGFYFRSPVDVLVKGLVKVENSTSGGNFETGAHAKVNLPLNFTVGYSYHPTPRTSYKVDFGFTRWSSFNRLYINADPVNAFDDIILSAIGNTPGLGTTADKDYRNGFSLHLGATHKVTDRLTLRGGGWYYWTPIPKNHFTPGVPDSNRLTFSLGLGYELTKNLVFDLSYYNSFFFRRHIDNDISNLVGGDVDGKYTSYLQAVSASITYKWDAFGDASGEQIEYGEPGVHPYE